MELYKELYEAICDFDMEEMVSIHNAYCRKMGYSDFIYRMVRFDEACDGMSTFAVVKKAIDGGFDTSRKYFVFDRDGNLWSFDVYEDSDINHYEDDIARYIERTKDTLRNERLRKILDAHKMNGGDR